MTSSYIFLSLKKRGIIMYRDKFKDVLDTCNIGDRVSIITNSMIIHTSSTHKSIQPIVGLLAEKNNEYISIIESQIPGDDGNILESRVLIKLNDISNVEIIDRDSNKSRIIGIDNQPSARISIPDEYYLYENPDGSICLCYKPNTKVSVITVFGKLVGYFGFGHNSENYITLVRKNNINDIDKEESLKIPLDIVIRIEIIGDN